MRASILNYNLRSVFLLCFAVFTLFLFPTLLLGEDVVEGDVAFKVRQHQIGEQGLKVDFRLENNSSNQVCLFAPPTISIHAGLFDNESGYFVRDWLDEGISSSGQGASGVSSPVRGKSVVRPGEYLDFDLLFRPIIDPTLVDVANVPVEGKVHRGALSIVSSITLTSCDFDQPDDAILSGRFQTLKAKDYRLKGNLDTLFPER